jgi:hypothetical protein
MKGRIQIWIRRFLNAHLRYSENLFNAEYAKHAEKQPAIAFLRELGDLGVKKL